MRLSQLFLLMIVFVMLGCASGGGYRGEAEKESGSVTIRTTKPQYEPTVGDAIDDSMVNIGKAIAKHPELLDGSVGGNFLLIMEALGGGGLFNSADELGKQHGQSLREWYSGGGRSILDMMEEDQEQSPPAGVTDEELEKRRKDYAERRQMAIEQYHKNKRKSVLEGLQ